LTPEDGTNRFYFGFLTPEVGTNRFYFGFLTPEVGTDRFYFEFLTPEDGTERLSQNSVINFNYLLCNDLEERSSPVLCEFRS